jgi:endonuclease/exonuclease/phosphatase family metal-dependent hydrolase
MYRQKGVVILIVALVLMIPQLFSTEEESCEVASGSDFRIMTFNIKNSSFLDGRDSWKNRSSAVVSMICRESPDVIGLQEVTPQVMEELKLKLSPAYAGYGVGRDNGYDSGEHNPVFFNKEKLIMSDRGTFWLAPFAPQIPTYGLAGKRIVTWAKFQFRESGEELFLFNTHFDNKSEEARRESALLLLVQIQSIAGGFPVILTGDLNAVPESEPYLILTSSSLDGTKLTDSRLSGAEPSHEVTYSGFDPGNREYGSTVDYVLVDESFVVQSYNILQDTINDLYLSDHRPVLVAVTLREGDE